MSCCLTCLWNVQEALAAAAYLKKNSLDTTQPVVLRFACQQLARKALKERALNRLSMDALGRCDSLVIRTAQLLERAPRKELEPGKYETLPPTLAPELAGDVVPYRDFHLLRKREANEKTEDDYRGESTVAQTPKLANLLEIPRREQIISMQSITECIEKLYELVMQLMRRAFDDSGGGAPLTVMAHESLQLIGHVFTCVIPLPAPPGTTELLWVPVNKEEQQRLLLLIRNCMYVMANIWQDMELQPRAFECERAVVAACMYCCFDKVLRTRATDGPLLMTEHMLRDGGYALPSNLDMTTKNLPFQQGSAFYELSAGHLCEARSAAVLYLAAVKAQCGGDGGRELFSRGLNLEQEATQAYDLTTDPTCAFVVSMVTRARLPVQPPGVPSRIQAVAEWICSSEEFSQEPFSQLAIDHPEFAQTRDVVTLYKFLSTMLPSSSENLRFQAARSDRPYTISFNSTVQGGEDFHRRQSSGIMWEVHSANPQNQTAYVRAVGLRTPMIWGQGDTINSPIDLGGRNYTWPQVDHFPLIDEDDVLHTPDANFLTSKLNFLSVQECEVLLSYLTVPYMRIPLVVGFLASGDRVTLLFQKYLQGVFSAVLFEQGPWIREEDEVDIQAIPAATTPDPRNPVLGAEFGLLLNEIQQCPEVDLPGHHMLSHAC